MNNKEVNMPRDDRESLEREALPGTDGRIWV